MKKFKQMVACVALAALPLSATASDFTVCFNINDGIGLRLDTTFNNTSIAVSGGAIGASYAAPVTGTALLIPGEPITLVGLTLLDAVISGPVVMELILDNATLNGIGALVPTDSSFPPVELTATLVSCELLPAASPQIGSGPGLLDLLEGS